MDFGLLERHLKLLDSELIEINKAVAVSRDPESEGLCEAGEYLVGIGFVAIQKYMTTVHSTLEVGKSTALDCAPHVNPDLTFAEAFNAGANYWKHMEEWIGILSKEGSLQEKTLQTIKSIEKVTFWAEYTCANLLAGLVKDEAFELSTLVPKILEWTENMENGTNRVS